MQLYERILQALQADEIEKVDVLQSLWGGYGELLRIHLMGCVHTSVIVKHIQLPEYDPINSRQHPKGWNTLTSHLRKLKSYQVEQYWYQHYANQCALHHQVAKCLYVEVRDREVLLIMQDLATCGFPRVIKTAKPASVIACLQWLAKFHAYNMGSPPQGLWETGTYWHLQTRPDELSSLQDARLKSAASFIDQRLSNTRFQTLVHGDAKLANFCFSDDLMQVAAVDFQYVGAGCGMKDVVLLFSSVMQFDETPAAITDYLDVYFGALKQHLRVHQSSVDGQGVEQEWRPLYELAWADFMRFIKGWSPGHWKVNHYSESLTEVALASVEKEMLKKG